MDTICSAERSALMARIKSKNTKPEFVVQRVVHRLGYRFRLHRKDLPGVPDLVVTSCNSVIFVHGCFWHQHSGCRRSNVPKSRPDYWLNKLSTNVSRDKSAIRRLRRNGWHVAVVWECETENQKRLERRLGTFLQRCSFNERR